MEKQLIFKMLLLFVVLSSCDGMGVNSADPVSSESVFATHLSDDFVFLTHNEEQEVHMEAQMTGRLHIEDKSFKVDDIVLIWPFNYSIEEQNGIYVIYDENKEFVAEEGDSLSVSGGQLTDINHLVSSEIISKLPPGPYWIMGEFVENLQEKN